MSNIEQHLMKYIDLLIERYPQLSLCRNEIINAYLVMEHCYKTGGKLLITGNGGSAADADHMVGELMKGFVLQRKLDSKFQNKLKEVNKELGEILAENLQGAMPAIALTGHFALSTAYMNDCEPTLGFAQQVNGFGNENDVFVGISTSGNSLNVVYAAIVAKAKGMKVIGLTGSRDSKISEFADVCIRVPNTETYIVQEYHLPIYHCLCLMLEDKFFGNK